MWSCAKSQKYLNAYLDGELPDRLIREVEKHLARCPACPLELDGLRALAPLLEKNEVPSVPAGLSGRILTQAALRQKQKGDSKISGREWFEFLFRPWLVRVTTIAALMLGLAMGTLMGSKSHLRSDMARWMASNETMTWNMYAFDVLGAEPRGSIEAATLALLDDRR